MKKFLLLVSLVIGAFAWVPFIWLSPQPPAKAAAPVHQVSQVEITPPLTRPNYRYSVVPYGVRFPEQLQYAVARNQNLADHFKDFDFSKARFIVLDKDSCAFVSFRKDNQIRWTSQCVPLHRGELILTDGRILIRARCANRISYIPQAPVDPTPVDELDRAEIPPPSEYPRVASNFALSNLPPLPPVAPPAIALTTANYPPIPPVSPVGSSNPVSGVPCCVPPVPPHSVAMPEADSTVMLGLCVLALAAAAYHRLRKSRQQV